MTVIKPVRARDLPARARLEEYTAKASSLVLTELFGQDPARGIRLATEACGICLDYSKNLLTDHILSALVDLARQAGLRERMEAMFAGEKINTSEGRAALHVALRAPRSTSIVVDGTNVVPEVHAVLERMSSSARAARDGSWLGHTGKPARNVINIGIGGLDIGPAMACQALRPYSDRGKVSRFVSNIDGAALIEALHGLDPAETLFIVCSKSWHTQETLVNANSAPQWLLADLGGDAAPVARQFVVVSANAGGVKEFGIGDFAEIPSLTPGSRCRYSPTWPSSPAGTPRGTSARCSAEKRADLPVQGPGRHGHSWA